MCVCVCILKMLTNVWGKQLTSMSMFSTTERCLHVRKRKLLKPKNLWLKVVLDSFTLLIWAQPNKLKLEFSINHKCSQFKMKSAIYTITAVIQWTSLLNVFIPQKKYLVCKTLGTLLAGQQYFMPYIPTLFVNSQAGSCVCYATCMHIYYLG